MEIKMNDVYLILSVCVLATITFFIGMSLGTTTIEQTECEIGKPILCQQIDVCQDCDKLLEQQKKMFEDSLDIVKGLNDDEDINCLYKPGLANTRIERSKILNSKCLQDAMSDVPDNTLYVKYTLSKGIILERICGSIVYGELTVEVQKTEDGTRTKESFTTNFELDDDTVTCKEQLRWN